VAMVTIFHMSTTAGWAEVMYNGMNSRGIDLQPERLYRPLIGFYFVIVIFICAFFIANMFIGVVISTFNKEKENLGKEYLLTNVQKEWIKTKILVLRSSPMVIFSSPKQWIRKPFFKIASSKYFDKFIYTCILLNTALMTLKWYGMDTEIEDIVGIVNNSFTSIFVMEAIIKITAFGRRYFKSKWNIMDFMIALFSFIAILLF
jgi:hypothetical protein